MDLGAYIVFRIKPLLITVVAIAALLTPYYAAAEETDKQIDGKSEDKAENTEEKAGAENSEMEEIVITASKFKEKLFLSLRSVNLITSKKIIDNQPRTTPEMLKESPGVFVQQTNMGGGSPIIRGLVGPQILILLDGIRLNNATFRTGPLQYLNLIDQYGLDKLEVVKGPGSVLFGSDAIGATLNALTFTPEDFRQTKGFGYKFRLGAKTTTASSEKTAYVGASAGYAGFALSFNGSYKSFDDLRGGDGVGFQPYTAYSQYNVSPKLAYRFSEGFLKGWEILLGYHAVKIMDAGRAEALLTKHKYDLYDNDHHLVYLRSAMKFSPIFTDVDVTFSYKNFYEQKTTSSLDANHTVVTKRVRDRVFVDSMGIDAQFTTDVFTNWLQFIYGAEYYHDFVESEKHSSADGIAWTKASRASYPNGSDYYLASGYLTADSSLLPKDGRFKLNLNAGYRFQKMGGGAGAEAGAGAVDYSAQAHIFSLGILGAYETNWMASFSWSQGFRAPNLQESVMIGDTGDWYNVANYDLGPEYADTLELITRFDFWRLRGSIAGYATFLRDLIKREPTQTEDGQTEVNKLKVVHNVNGSKGRIYGFEAELAMKLWFGFSLKGTAAYAYGLEYLDAEKDAKKRGEQPLSKIPPLFGSANLRWDFKDKNDSNNIFIEAYILWALKQDRLSDLDLTDVRIPAGGTPGFVTYNARAGASFNKTLNVHFSIENISNVKYKYHVSGIYGAGTNAAVGVEVNF